MVIATKTRWTNLLQINLKINVDIINVKSRDFGKTLQLPFSKDYSYQIWTLGNVKDTNQSYINLTATDDVILTKSFILHAYENSGHKTWPAERFIGTDSI